MAAAAPAVPIPPVNTALAPAAPATPAAGMFGSMSPIQQQDLKQTFQQMMKQGGGQPPGMAPAAPQRPMANAGGSTLAQYLMAMTKGTGGLG